MSLCKIIVESISGIEDKVTFFKKNEKISSLKVNLHQYFKEYSILPTFIIKDTNKAFESYELLSDIAQNDYTIYVQARFPIKGGKGGFGANLRSSKKQPKTTTSVSKTYYKDLKTDVKVKDLIKLKKAREILQNQANQTSEEKEAMNHRKEKLHKTIEYYESILTGKSTNQHKFNDTDFLETVDQVMLDLRDKMEVALQLEESEDYDSDWETSDEIKSGVKLSKPEAKERPKFTKFFDDDDDESEEGN